MRHFLIACALVSVLHPTGGNADVLNLSSHPIYVQDEDWGRVHMLLPGERWSGKQDGFATPFSHRSGIYKITNGVSVIVHDNAKIDVEADSARGNAAQIILGGWKDRDWVLGKNGYQFRRLFNLSAQPQDIIPPQR